MTHLSARIWSRSSAPRRRRALLELIGVTGLVIAAACSDEVPKPIVTQTPDLPETGNCTIDAWNDFATAKALTLDENGTAATDETLCPRGDIDYFTFPVGGPRSLVALTVDSETLSSARLSARWYGPTGACMPDPVTACDADAPCATGLFCDEARGGCRTAAARVCNVDPDCGPSERCVITRSFIAEVREPDVGSINHRIRTNLAATLAGDYVLAIEDAAHAQTPLIAYSVLVHLTQDPDTHEPNDATHMATPLVSGVVEQAFFSSAGDVDWYTIDPAAAPLGFTTPPVVRVEVRWPKGIDAEPVWSLTQGTERPYYAAHLPDRGGADNASRAVYAMTTTEPLYLQVRNPSGVVDTASGYSVELTLSEDPDEGATRNDRLETATPLTATGPGPILAPTAHTLVAENDTDWYRIDRPGATENTLLYLKATAAPDAPFLLQALTFLKTGDTCDPDTEERCLPSGDLCVCLEPTGCAAGEGVCLEPWAQRPVPRDPGGDDQFGGRSPNHLEAQLPLFGVGDGALFLQMSHIKTTPLIGLAGFSASVPYTLTLTHKLEPDAADKNTSQTGYFPLPFGVEAASFFAAASATPLTATSAGSPTVQGFLSLAPEAQLIIDPAADSCAPLTFNLWTPRGLASSAVVNVTLTTTPAAGITLVSDCPSGTAIGAPVALTGPTPTLGLAVAAGALAALPQELTLHLSGEVETVDLPLTVTQTALPRLQLTGRQPSAQAPIPPAPRSLTTAEPSAPIRLASSAVLQQNLLVDLSVTPAAVHLGSGDFGPTAQYCPCDIDCVDVCECAGAGCNLCACDPDPGCSTARGCTCSDTTDAVCAGLTAAPFSTLSPACNGSLYGAAAQAQCQLWLRQSQPAVEVDIAKPTPGAAVVVARAAGYATASLVLVADSPATLTMNPPATFAGQGFISYDGDQDWFVLDTTGFPKASARLQVVFAPSRVDLRFRVFRGGNPDSSLAITGLGRTQDLCDLPLTHPGDGCATGGTCDTERHTCDYDALGTTTSPATIDPAEDCTYLADASDRLYVWVNDVDFNDWDEAEPYSFRVDLVAGCSTACSPMRCAR